MASFAALFAAKPRAAAPPEEPLPDSLFEGKKKKRKRGGAAAPQPPAIRASRELNKELTRLARGKQLTACRAAFEAAKSSGVADSWSHAIVINAHATCGDGAGALAALAAMRAAGHRPCVMSYTASLKAPCACGDLGAARRLLAEMERDFAAAAAAASAAAASAAATSAALDDWTANVRTANTFLRGCLVAGGVDDALRLLDRLGAAGVWAAAAPDTSSFEYAGTLCAMALRVDDAARLAARARAGGGARAAHAAARVHVAACRAAALLGARKRCVAQARAARELLAAPAAALDDAAAADGDGDGGGGESRATFRAHQRAEALAELDALEERARATPPPGAAMPLLLKRALPLPPAAAAAGVGAAVAAVVDELGGAFGLDAWRETLNRRAAGAGDAKAEALRRRLRRVLRGGAIDLDALFDRGGGSGGARDEAEEGTAGGPAAAPPPARLELGCGAGEWVAAQAAAEPDVRWLALELRRDRAHATASRLALGRLANAAVLAGDATAALRRWLPRGSLEAIFVNHPAPPQQAPPAADGGGGPAAAPEAEHMLDAALLDAAAAALRPARGAGPRGGAGTLTIVSDNAWYAGLLLDALARHGSYAQAPYAAPTPAGARRVRAAGGIELVAAPPGPWCGWRAESSSYFDRLWRTGISAHSAAHERFVLHVARAT